MADVRRMAATEDDYAPWSAPPSRRQVEPLITADLPKRVTLVLGNQIYIQRRDLPAPLITRLVRLATFQNPEFYAAQGMRLPTFDEPRIISCAELFPQHLALPRGYLAQYAGRLHRLYATKREVIIYDYVDGEEAMLAKMARKREAGYESLGYREIAFDGSGAGQCQYKLTDC